MKLWIAIWDHRHGTESVVLWCAEGYTPTIKDAVSLLDGEYEPEKGESISIDSCGLSVPKSPAFPKPENPKQENPNGSTVLP